MLQAFLCHGKTDETATMLRHEVDRLRRDLFCCQGEVAFVLAILVIHDHNHATGTDLLDRCGNVCKTRVQCHVQLNFSSRGERSRTGGGCFWEFSLRALRDLSALAVKCFFVSVAAPGTPCRTGGTNISRDRGWAKPYGEQSKRPPDGRPLRNCSCLR